MPRDWLGQLVISVLLHQVHLETSLSFVFAISAEDYKDIVK